MVTIQVKNIEGKTTLPIQGSNVAAGYDIIAVDDPIIVGDFAYEKDEIKYYHSIDYLEYHTALYISPQRATDNPRVDNYPIHTLIHPRSSVRKYNLVLANSIGLVDNDYRGEIIVCYKYIWQPKDLVMAFQQVSGTDGGSDYISEPTGELLGKLDVEKIYKKGDKIAQLVGEPTIPLTFKLVSELDATQRGDGGFGSTDTKLKMDVSAHVAIGNSIEEKYLKYGGVPTKRPYIEELKEREQK